MYSVLLTVALSPMAPDAAPKASAGCLGSVKSQGCTSTVQYVAAPAASCHGGAARSFRTPVRSLLHRATTPRGRTTYYPVSAVYVPVATPVQSAAPAVAVGPAFRAPVRQFLFCPNGRCPK